MSSSADALNPTSTHTPPSTQPLPNAAQENHLRCSDKWWTAVKVAALVVAVVAVSHAHFAALPYYAAGFAFLGLVALLGYRHSSQPDPKITQQVIDLTQAKASLTTERDDAVAAKGTLTDQVKALKQTLATETEKVQNLAAENLEYSSKNSTLAEKLKEAQNPEKMKLHQAAETVVYQTWIQELKDKLHQLEEALAKAQEPVQADNTALPDQPPTS